MSKGIVRLAPQDFFMQTDRFRIIFDTKGIVSVDIADGLGSVRSRPYSRRSPRESRGDEEKHCEVLWLAQSAGCTIPCEPPEFDHFIFSVSICATRPLWWPTVCRRRPTRKMRNSSECLLDFAAHVMRELL
jgi:hypothetical protein